MCLIQIAQEERATVDVLSFFRSGLHIHRGPGLIYSERRFGRPPVIPRPFFNPLILIGCVVPPNCSSSPILTRKSELAIAPLMPRYSPTAPRIIPHSALAGFKIRLIQASYSAHQMQNLGGATIHGLAHSMILPSLPIIAFWVFTCHRRRPRRKRKFINCGIPHPPACSSPRCQSLVGYI